MILKRYPVFIFGLYFLSLSIVLIVRSALDITLIFSINYVLSLNSTLSLGTWTFLFNLLLILGQFWLIRDCHNRQDIMEILLNPLLLPVCRLYRLQPAAHRTAAIRQLRPVRGPALRRISCAGRRRRARNQTPGSHDECRSLCEI